MFKMLNIYLGTKYLLESRHTNKSGVLRNLEHQNVEPVNSYVKSNNLERALN